MRGLPWVGLLLLFAGSAQAVEVSFGGFGQYAPDRSVPCLTEEERARIRARLEISRQELAAQEEGMRSVLPQTVSLAWPLRLRAGAKPDYGYHGISNFVDQDLAFPGHLLDYQCGARTYDLDIGYNHSGVDFFSWPFGWKKMDDGDVEVVAAAPGMILTKDDGNYDRSCGFGGAPWNAVYIQHADGSQAWYGHLKSGSLTAKQIGELVEQGEFLGVVGSSGNSTGPHLHLEIYGATGGLNDPYAGPCNSLNATSWWATQRPYYDSAINAVMTHSVPPYFPGCPTSETPNATDVFQAGQTAYFAAYYRDQLAGQVSSYSVRDANGALVASWSHSSPEPHYAASYWYWSLALPSFYRLGQWRFQVVYQGNTYVHDFYVVSSTVDVADAPLRLELERVGADPAPGAVELEFRLPRSGHARLAVFDTRGRQVARLIDGWQPAGGHRVRWIPAEAGAGPGLYLAKLQLGDGVVARKVLVTR